MKVKCINATESDGLLTRDAIYDVEDTGIVFRLRNGTGWSKSRFEIIEEEKQMTKLKRVKCINNTYDHIAEGEEFDVISETEDAYCVKTNNAGKLTYPKGNFITISQKYTLELSEEEARTLYVLVGSVVGSWENSPRKHTCSVYHLLSKCFNGCGADKFTESKLLSVKDNVIRFHNYTVLKKSPEQLKIEELEATIAQAQSQLQELKGMK